MICYPTREAFVWEDAGVEGLGCRHTDCSQHREAVSHLRRAGAAGVAGSASPQQSPIEMKPVPELLANVLERVTTGG